MKWVGAVLLVSAVAQAQVAPERELEVVRSMFNAGNYKLALERAQDAMAMTNFTELQRVELHKYAGVSAFNLGDAVNAERHFVQLLQINPDFVLDPFAVPPPAIKLFEEVKRKNADALNLIRQNIALREEQTRRDAAELARRKQLEDNERDRLQALSANRQVKIVERHPFILNFVPFGAGQFVQGRNDWGIAFAVVEAVAGVTSVIAYWAVESLFEQVPVTVHEAYSSATGKFMDIIIFARTIPSTRANDDRVWSSIKWVSGAIFYLVTAAGIFDALWHHKGEVVNITTEPANSPALPSINFSFSPTPGGATGGLTISF